MFYITTTPKLLRKLYKNRLWEMPQGHNQLYLTFDDGPHPVITPWVLDLLASYNAKATFFCIGANVKRHPELYRRILEEGHAVGNHTMNHLNGWKVNDKAYLDDIEEAQKLIDSHLFRPPYGRLSRFQQKQLEAPKFNFKVVMWNVLSADFDISISKERCLQNVLLHTKDGAIIIFHDSEKAKKNMEFALPKVLKFYADKGFSFSALNEAAFNLE